MRIAAVANTAGDDPFRHLIDRVQRAIGTGHHFEALAVRFSAEPAGSRHRKRVARPPDLFEVTVPEPPQWSPAELREHVEKLLAGQRIHFERVWLIGQSVARAMDLSDEVLTPLAIRRWRPAFVVPDPSPGERWWADSQNRARWARFVDAHVI